MIARCMYCRSQSIATLHEDGIMVCVSCGAVLKEHMIDDSPQPRRTFEDGAEARPKGPPIVPPRVPRGLRRVARSSLRRGLVYLASSGAAMRFSDAVAERVIDSDPRIGRAYRMIVSSIPGIARRSPRVRVGLAVYVALISRGYSKSRALSEAARVSRSSVSTLEKAAREYCERLEEIVRLILIYSG